MLSEEAIRHGAVNIPAQNPFKTRADLMQHPAFADLGADTSGNPLVWENHYSCRSCTSEQVDWSDNWSCQCNDACPNCGAETEPEQSIWRVSGQHDFMDQIWAGLPEKETP